MFDSIEDKQKLELAIKKKYGDESIQNLRKDWNFLKQQEYEKQIKQIQVLEDNKEEIEKENFIELLKIKRKSFSNCETCEKCILSKDDYFFYLKFNVCENCFITYIEDRETRWENGWRPKKKS